MCNIMCDCVMVVGGGIAAAPSTVEGIHASGATGATTGTADIPAEALILAMVMEAVATATRVNGPHLTIHKLW